MKRLWILCILAGSGTLPLFATPPVATLQISTETAPSSTWVQLKFSLTKPLVIGSGRIVMDLDPTVFGPIQAAGVFGANGDAYGLAAISSQHLDAQFYSASGGIGQLAALPVLVVSVLLQPSASAQPQQFPVTATATLSDAGGNAYSATVLPGSVIVASGIPSVQTVQSGMGVLPAGSVVPVIGTGFTASTSITIDGVSIASAKFASQTEIDLTLGAPAELTGKYLHLTGSGAEVDYFCFQPAGPSQLPAGYSGGQPMFPLQGAVASQVNLGSLGGVIALENPQGTPVVVQLQSIRPDGTGLVNEGTTNLTIPAGGWTVYGGIVNSAIYVTSPSPVRALAITNCSPTPSASTCVSPAMPSSAVLTPPQPVATPSSLAFQWQIGSTGPAARVIYITAANPVTTATSGAPWLVVTQSGNAFNPTLTLTISTTQLALGTYQGSVLVTAGYGTPLTIPVTLTVTTTAPLLLSSDTASINFAVPSSNSPPASQAVAITSTGPVQFSLTVTAPWILVTSSSGATPATLTVTYDPSVLSQLYNQQSTPSGAILINSPGNSLAIPVQVTSAGLLTSPTSLVFSAQTGSAAQTQMIGVNPAGVLSASVSASWLTSVSTSTNAVSVTADPSGLKSGIYNAAVTITQAGIGSVQVPVTFSLWDTPPPLQVTPANLTFTLPAGGSAPAQFLSVQSGGVPLNFSTSQTANWLFANNMNNAPTPTTVGVAIVGPALQFQLGEYNAEVVLTAPSGTVNVPVTLLIAPGPASQPVLASVVNGASLLSGGVSPGEIVTLRGYGVGSSSPTGLQLDVSGKVQTTSSGAQVLFDGKPAPIVYTSANQTNVVVPYEVAGETSTTIQVLYNGMMTAAWGVPVVAAAPAIFTLDSTGTGQGAILNQDYSVNGALQPAAIGSIVQIYATGEGQTSPTGITGLVNGSALKRPILPVKVSIGGVDAEVFYAGSAPGEIAGLLQINVLVPTGVPSGPAPVVLTIGGTQSPPATIAIQ